MKRTVGFTVAWMICMLRMSDAAAIRHDDPEARRGTERRQVLFNERWEYCEDASRTLAALRRSKTPWHPVRLPHTWNAFDAVDNTPGYRRSASWYRRTFRAGRGPGRLVLVFEGVSMSADVFVNGSRAGGHVGGYVGFEVDVTPWVKAVGGNEILIRVDNSITPDIIPSQKSDFFLYGGITRNVWLRTVPPRHIRRLAIATPAVTRRSATTAVEVVLQNSETEGARGVVTVVLSDRRGREVARSEREVQVRPGESSAHLDLPPIAGPELWSPTDPALYTARATLTVSGKTVDALADRYGYRWCEFRDHGPFFLNGERLLLRGTHRHEEFAGLGNALTDSLHRKDIEMIKRMGANFVRLAHYPQAPEVYRACDELGILVWDELPWCRGGMGGERWKENTRRLLREQISQNFNHPSIILWSLGNELYWLPDFPGGDAIDSLRTMVRELHTLARTMDSGRKTAVRKFYEGSDIVDVFSPSIWAGWYSGVYHTYEASITEARRKYPHLLHMEYGGDSHAGRHSENPIDGDGATTPGPWDTDFRSERVKNVSLAGDWSETYLVDLVDWHLHVTERLDWFGGNAQWSFKDFGTPLRPENPIPYVNQKGVVDRAGNPKDAYYVFKSYWTVTPSFCYIQSHTWDERSGPKGAPRPVRVYSNCAEVELFLNGQSLGRKSRDAAAYPAHGLLWSVPFEEGRNLLAAAGTLKGEVVARDSTSVIYTTRKNGQAERLELTAARFPDGRILVTATARDRNGLRCLDYNKRVYFAMEGDGHLVTDFGTPTGSSVIEMANGVSRIEYVAEPPGRAVIEVRSTECRGSYLPLPEGISREDGGRNGP